MDEITPDAAWLSRPLPARSRERLPSQRSAGIAPVIRLGLRLASLIALLSACEQTFQPIQPSDLYFSIYGYLDASVDTQWIRVSPVRTVTETSLEPLQAVARLEHLPSGRSVPLFDSLFVFPSNNLDADRYAWNFGTDEPMEPGATYRFTVTRADGRFSSATARVPEDVDHLRVDVSQAPVFSFTPWTYGVLHVPTTEQLAMVHVIHLPPCPATRGPFTFSPSLTGINAAAGPERHVPIMRKVYAPPGPPECDQDRFRFLRWDLFVVLTGSPWPFDPHLPDPENFLPDTGTNVTNGTGFLGGIITHTIPFERCFVIGLSGATDYCVLTYDDRKAAVEGVLSDASCPTSLMLQFPGSSLFLWENSEPDTPGSVTITDYQGSNIGLRKPPGTRVRAAFALRDRSYRIDALEPGVEYAIRAPLEGFLERVDTIVLQAGEQRRLDIGLLRSRPGCN